MKHSDYVLEFILRANKYKIAKIIHYNEGLIELHDSVVLADVYAAIVEAIRWMLDQEHISQALQHAAFENEIIMLASDVKDLRINIQTVDDESVQRLSKSPQPIEFAYENRMFSLTITLYGTGYVDASQLVSSLLFYLEPTTLGEICNGSDRSRCGVSTEP